MKYLTNWNAKTRVDDLLTTDRYLTATSEPFVRYFPQPRFWIVSGLPTTREVADSANSDDFLLLMIDASYLAALALHPALRFSAGRECRGCKAAAPHEISEMDIGSKRVPF